MMASAERVMLVRLSSLGDIIHTWPALTDLHRQRPGIELHWLVESDYAELAALHPLVQQVWPVSLRRLLRQRRRVDWQCFQQQRADWRSVVFDRVLDSQGLIKSALISRQVRAHSHHGFAAGSSRERLAGWFTGQGHQVDPALPAICRYRELLADVFGYQYRGEPDFGVADQFTDVTVQPERVLLLPGTAWLSKRWSPQYWQTLAARLLADGATVTMLWGDAAERQLASGLAAQLPALQVPDERLPLPALARLIAGQGLVVGLDSGLSHLAGALGRPTVTLFGASSLDYAGVPGRQAHNISAGLSCSPCQRRQCPRLPPGSKQTPPCMAALTADQVWQQVSAIRARL